MASRSLGPAVRTCLMYFRTSFQRCLLWRRTLRLARRASRGSAAIFGSFSSPSPGAAPAPVSLADIADGAFGRYLIGQPSPRLRGLLQVLLQLLDLLFLRIMVREGETAITPSLWRAVGLRSQDPRGRQGVGARNLRSGTPSTSRLTREVILGSCRASSESPRQ